MFVADPEKAVVDGVYLNALPENMMTEVVERMDRRKLEMYVRRYEGHGRKKLERCLI